MQRTGSGVVVVVRWKTQWGAVTVVKRTSYFLGLCFDGLGLTLFVGVEATAPASLRFAGRLLCAGSLVSLVSLGCSFLHRT